MSIWRRINWVNALFLTLVPIIAIVGTTLFAVFGLIHWPTWILAGAILMATGFSITAGYHRLFAHKSYKAAWPVRLFFILFGAAAFEGSVLEWSTDHRVHHRYTDTDKDPYDIKKGFWYAHIGWLFTLDTSKRDFSNVQDLMADPLIRFQHKFYVPLAILMGFGFPAAIAAIWGDPLSGLIVAGALRITVNHHFTFFINSICHMFGKRTYSEKQSARDNWFTAFLTFGEGYHNFHHQFPLDYRNGVRLYQFDPTKWLIRSVAYMGLAKDLKRISQEKILRYRIRTDEQRYLARADHPSVKTHFTDMLKPVYDRIQQTLSYIEQLEKNCATLQQRKMKHVKRKLKVYRHHIKQARRELNSLHQVWSQLIQQKHYQPLNLPVQ